MTGPAPTAVAGWFRADPPALLGRRCDECGDVAFPPGSPFCANPACAGTQFTTTELSTSGTIWSYTDARYQPPPPYVSRHDPFVPFAIAAVELAEGLVVLGQVVEGYGADDLRVGDVVDLVVEPLDLLSGGDLLMWRWRPRVDRRPAERGAP